MGRVSNLDNSAVFGRPSGVGIAPQDLVINGAHLRCSLDQFNEPGNPTLHILQRHFGIRPRCAILAIRVQVLQEHGVSPNISPALFVKYLVCEHPRDDIATAPSNDMCTRPNHTCV